MALISWWRLSRYLLWSLLFLHLVSVFHVWYLIHLYIYQILGTPTREEIRCMNPNYTEFKFPQIKAHPWHKVCEITARASLLHAHVQMKSNVAQNSSDLPQANATWSSRPRLKTPPVFTEPSLHCSKTKSFWTPQNYINLLGWFGNF